MGFLDMAYCYIYIIVKPIYVVIMGKRGRPRKADRSALRKIFDVMAGITPEKAGETAGEAVNEVMGFGRNCKTVAKEFYNGYKKSRK